MLRKFHFVITAGGTREYIDPVRFISNASSGKMGYSFAEAAIKQGHGVTLITAATNIAPPAGAKVVKVETACQMFAAVKKAYAKCDCLIMAAAVSDYTPAKVSRTKLKKSGSNLVLTLKPTADILAWAGQHKKKQFLVGFALEDKNLKSRARKKLQTKNLDMIIANTPQTIGAKTAEVQILTSDNTWTSIPRKSKNLLAQILLKVIQKHVISAKKRDIF